MDTTGLLLRVVVTPADLSDRDGAKVLLAGIKKSFPNLSLIWADQAYVGQDLASWIEREVGCKLVLTKRLGQGVWVVQGEDPPPPDTVHPTRCRSSPGDGSWSEPSPGSGATAGFPKTTRASRQPKRR